MTTSTMDTMDRDDAREGEEPPADGAAEIGAGRVFPWTLIITGALGLLAAWVITIDKFKLLEAEIAGEVYTPGCSLNPIVSCGSVMESEQAEAFGFPNPMIGLVAYSVVICIGVAVLAGARYRPWFWYGLQGGTLFGVGFCTWLQYQSLYVISALCLWCSLAWVATIVMFWYTTLHNVRHGLIRLPQRLRAPLLEFHWAGPTLWIGLIGMLVLVRWWDFWTS